MTRVKRTRAQWQRFIEEQPSSGLTITEYCQQHQLTVSGFYNWRKKLSEQESPVHDWLSYSAPDSVAAKQAHWQMELELPGGLMLRVSQLN
jgi:putative transposase